MPPKVQNARQLRRETSWKRGQERKAERVRVQKEAEARNRVLRARGELTPWQKAKAAAKARKRDGKV